MLSPSSALVLLSAAALTVHVRAQLGELPGGLGGIGDDDTPATVVLTPPAEYFYDYDDPEVAFAPAAAPVGVPVDLPEEIAPAEALVTGETQLTRVEQPFLANLPRLCNCTTPPLNEAGQIKTDDIRNISNQFCDGGDSPMNSFGLSNMVWAWGQFLDHDIVGSDEDGGREHEVEDIMLDGPNRVMPLETLGPIVGDGNDGECEGQPNKHTGLIDGHPIYSGSAAGEASLRNGDSCLLLVTPNPEGTNGDFLPLGTGFPGTAEESEIFLVAGDLRVNEHSVLTTMHTIWVREHNRLCSLLDNNPQTSDLTGDEKFDIVKSTVISKMQWITIREFLPALGIRQPQLNQKAAEGFTVDNSLSTVEFSIAWRLGHTVIPDMLGTREISDLFRGERNFLMEEVGPDPAIIYQPSADALIDDLVQTLATTTASEVDGKMSNALRNILFGINDEGDESAMQQLDLCSFNIFRGRDLHIPTYAGLAECMGITPDAATEAETPDAWLGLLREPRKSSRNVFGPTLEALIIEHFARVLFGPHGNYFLARNPLGRELRSKTQAFRAEIFQTTMASVLSANSGANLRGNAFLV